MRPPKASREQKRSTKLNFPPWGSTFLAISGNENGSLFLRHLGRPWVADVKSVTFAHLCYRPERCRAGRAAWRSSSASPSSTPPSPRPRTPSSTFGSDSPLSAHPRPATPSAGPGPHRRSPFNMKYRMEALI